MERINGILFKQMLESGMNNLSNHSAEIDALNVFPVPDGCEKIETDPQNPDIIKTVRGIGYKIEL